VTFDEFQEAAGRTAIYPRSLGLVYTALGLASEAGEVAGKVKKSIRDTAPVREAVADELGDVLWYAAMLAKELDLSLSEIAERNVRKLSDRAQRGALQGSGDRR